MAVQRPIFHFQVLPVRFLLSGFKNGPIQEPGDRTTVMVSE